ncbi:MAG: AraC family transcriptional regulator [Rhodospirillaceae bacterium]|nr:MAG: AraC family transcriptional regulator [Rhodospirillaceae bacterium]
MSELRMTRASDAPEPDRLAAVFARVRFTARVFYTGKFCAIHEYGRNGGPGHIHLLRAGRMVVEGDTLARTPVEAPTAILFPRAGLHRLIAVEKDEAELVCAEIDLGGPSNPLEQGLPPVLILPLEREDVLGTALGLLFAEASAQESGCQAALDRLAEVAFIYILRRMTAAPQPGYGLLAGLAHPALSRVLTHLHQDPGADWSLERMADEAGMSRSVFAETFRETVGIAPGNYLTRWRLSLARSLLQAGQPAKTVARQVGYASPAAFSRAFTRQFGMPAGESAPECDPIAK